MNQQLLAELCRSEKGGSLIEQLRTDRELRYFLLHLIDNPEENMEIVNTMAPLYQSEISKLPKQKKPKEFDHILNLFNNGDKPVTFGAELSTDERKQILLALVPEEFTKLRDEISMIDPRQLTTPVFASMAHTFAFYDNMAKENAALEERIQALSDIRQFTPDAENVFIPKTTPPPSAPTSARSSALSSRGSSRTSRPPSSVSNAPKTARLPYSGRHYESPRVASSRLQYPHVRVTSKIDTLVEDNTYLREQISSREAELSKNRRTEKKLNDAIKQRRNDVSHLQTEIEKLRAQLEKLKQEDASKHKEQVRLDDASKQMLMARKKEANNLTIKLQAALAENRRLKRLDVPSSLE